MALLRLLSTLANETQRSQTGEKEERWSTAYLPGDNFLTKQGVPTEKVPEVEFWIRMDIPINLMLKNSRKGLPTTAEKDLHQDAGSIY